MITEKDFVIGEKHFKTFKYQLNYSIELSAELFKILGKPISMVWANLETDVMAVLGDAIDSLFANVEPKEIFPLCKKILKGTHVIDREKNTHRDVNPDLDFDDMVEMFDVIKEIFPFQFAALLKRIAAGIPAQTATPKAKGRIKAI